MMPPRLWPIKLDGLIVTRLRFSRASDMLRLAREFRARGYAPGDIEARIRFLLSPNAIRLGRIEPLEQALALLGPRAREDESTGGGFRLDGRPAQASNITAEAQRIQARMGLAKTEYPGVASLAFSEGVRA